MEDNTNRRKRDLRDVSHYFFSSKEECEKDTSSESRLHNDSELENSTMSPRSIVDEIKDAIGSDVPESLELAPHTDDVTSDEINEYSAYDIIEKETKSFLQPLSDDVVAPENVQETVDDASTKSFDSPLTGFTPRLKSISLVPVEAQSFSLLLNVYFAKYLLHSPYKVYIISANPHPDSWNFLERTLNLPALVDIDFSKGLRTFSIFNSVDLIVVQPDAFEEFFTFKNIHGTNPQLFDSQGKQLLFLIDHTSVNDVLQNRIASIVDCFIMLTSGKNESLRAAYKAIKSYSAVAPDASFKCVLNEKEDVYLEEFLEREFNVIVSQFLKRAVDFIGFCDSDIFVRGNNIKWNTKEKEHVFSLTTDFLAELKKENWNEEMLSFYQTVISNVKF